MGEIMNNKEQEYIGKIILKKNIYILDHQKELINENLSILQENSNIIKFYRLINIEKIKQVKNFH